MQRRIEDQGVERAVPVSRVQVAYDGEVLVVQVVPCGNLRNSLGLVATTDRAQGIVEARSLRLKVIHQQMQLGSTRKVHVDLQAVARELRRVSCDSGVVGVGRTFVDVGL